MWWWSIKKRQHFCAPDEGAEKPWRYIISFKLFMTFVAIKLISVSSFLMGFLRDSFPRYGPSITFVQGRSIILIGKKRTYSVRRKSRRFSGFWPYCNVNEGRSTIFRLSFFPDHMISLTPPSSASPYASRPRGEPINIRFVGTSHFFERPLIRSGPNLPSMTTNSMSISG